MCKKTSYFLFCAHSYFVLPLLWYTVTMTAKLIPPVLDFWKILQPNLRPFCLQNLIAKICQINTKLFYLKVSIMNMLKDIFMNNSYTFGELKQYLISKIIDKKEVNSGKFWLNWMLGRVSKVVAHHETLLTQWKYM